MVLRDPNMAHGYAGKTYSLVKNVVLGLLRGYKKYVSPVLPHACRFEPTCSVYMVQAIQKRGLLKGLILGVKRLLRCHPFCAGGLDPVP